jgi:N-acetyltransferase
MRLSPEILTGRHVILEPVQEAHRERLRAAANDPETWRFNPTRADGPHFDPEFNRHLADHAAGTRIVHTVRRRADNALVGQTSYMNISPNDRRVEIGSTWYAPEARGGPINPECKLLLLSNAFAAGAIRVELKTDARNLRSRAAIRKLGAIEEGALRRHTRMWDGFMRDTVYYSILDDEWPSVRARLKERI